MGVTPLRQGVRAAWRERYQPLSLDAVLSGSAEHRAKEGGSSAPSRSPRRTSVHISQEEHATPARAQVNSLGCATRRDSRSSSGARAVSRRWELRAPLGPAALLPSEERGHHDTYDADRDGCAKLLVPDPFNQVAM